MENARQKLINIAKGGDGRIDNWIERVTFQRPGKEDQVGYILHIVAGSLVFDVPFLSLEAARGLDRAVTNGGQPADHELTAEELAARDAALPPPEDNGRVVGCYIDLTE